MRPSVLQLTVREVIGALQTCVRAWEFASKNASGIPRCCPATADEIAGIVFDVLKKAVSRLLLFGMDDCGFLLGVSSSK
jgi:hypothetical protein